MRRFASSVFAIFLCIVVSVGCGCSSSSQKVEKSVPKLTIGFVKSVDEEEILQATEPLKDLLKTEMILKQV